MYKSFIFLGEETNVTVKVQSLLFLFSQNEFSHAFFPAAERKQPVVGVSQENLEL